MAQRLLVISSLALIGGMLLLVPWLTESLGTTLGYSVVFCIYWFGFCLPLGLAFQGGDRARNNLSLDVGKARWVPWAVALQVAVICIANWTVLPDRVPSIAIGLAAVAGIINGFAEEFYWRGAYLEQGREQPLFQALGVGLFTLWHVPLALAHGVTYEGGAAALVGSAFALGIFWSVIANRTGRTGWPIVAHVLTNMVAFVGLFAMNFV